LRFGLPLCLSGLLVFVVFNIDNFVIGSFMGTSQLGYYTIAFTWATYGCTTMYETVHSVLFPRFSQMQQSRADLAAMYYRSLRVVMFIAVMANAILFAVADGFLVTVLGKGSPRWLPSLVPLEILCVYGALRASMEPVANVIMALGRSKVLLWAILLPIIVELSFLPLVTLRWGLPGVAVLVCGAYALQWVIYGPFLQRELNVGPGKLLRLAIPASLAAVSAVVMSRAIRSNDPLSWATIILRSVTVGAVFTVVHEALTRGGMLSEIKLIMNSRIRKPNGTRAECAISPPAIRPSAM
jgi:O-antigen/teichoic acid export membrane protein